MELNNGEKDLKHDRTELPDREGPIRQRYSGTASHNEALSLERLHVHLLEFRA